MVTYFNRKDLVSFGEYLLSEKRKALFQEKFDMQIASGNSNAIPVEDKLKNVYHSDIENWIASQED